MYLITMPLAQANYHFERPTSTSILIGKEETLYQCIEQGTNLVVLSPDNACISPILNLNIPVSVETLPATSANSYDTPMHDLIITGLQEALDSATKDALRWKQCYIDLQGTMRKTLINLEESRANASSLSAARNAAVSQLQRIYEITQE